MDDAWMKDYLSARLTYQTPIEEECEVDVANTEATEIKVHALRASLIELRQEVRELRADMKALRGEMHAESTAIRREMHAGFADHSQRIYASRVAECSSDWQSGGAQRG